MAAAKRVQTVTRVVGYTRTTCGSTRTPIEESKECWQHDEKAAMDEEDLSQSLCCGRSWRRRRLIAALPALDHNASGNGIRPLSEEPASCKKSPKAELQMKHVGESSIEYARLRKYLARIWRINSIGGRIVDSFMTSQQNHLSCASPAHDINRYAGSLRAVFMRSDFWPMNIAGRSKIDRRQVPGGPHTPCGEQLCTRHMSEILWGKRFRTLTHGQKVCHSAGTSVDWVAQKQYGGHVKPYQAECFRSSRGVTLGTEIQSEAATVCLPSRILVPIHVWAKIRPFLSLLSARPSHSVGTCQTEWPLERASTQPSPDFEELFQHSHSRNRRSPAYPPAAEPMSTLPVYLKGCLA